MQSISPLTESDFRERAKEPVNKLEIFIDPDWINLCDLGGKNYLISANYSKGQKELSYKPIAATVNALIDDMDGNFHPQNPDGSYNTYIKVGRKIRFSTGFKKSSIDYFWQWFEGVISDVSRDNTNRQISLMGFDYSQYLTEIELKSPDNYWGTSVTKSAIKDQAEYPMPAGCNGPYIAYLDSVQLYNEKHWVYHVDDNKFIFLPDHVPSADGVDNLKIYYYTSQIPENVIADILVSAKLYVDQAAALADMDYKATGITLGKVWFNSGIKCLSAITKICERCDYQFYFKYNNKPAFKPPSAIGGWRNKVFDFPVNLIADPDYQENIDEIRNNIIIEGDKYSDHDRLLKILTGDDMLDKSIKDRHMKEVVTDLPYETQEAVSPERDVIVPFYVPSTMLTVNYVYLNLYFPGLQDGDYPLNSPNLYMIPTSYAYFIKKNGSFYTPASDELGYFYVSGTGADGVNYYWYRGFLRYHIASLLGFKIDKAELRWTLNSRASVGAGANTEHSSVLHSIADFGTPDESIWGFATAVDHGNINIYTDVIRTAYSKDITTRIQDLLTSLERYACFRIQSSGEPVDVNNANNYRINMPETLYCEMSEDTAENVSVYYDNGAGYGLFGSYNSDQENLDLTSHFSGTGKKALKFTCAKTRRVDVLVRVGLTVNKIW